MQGTSRGEKRTHWLQSSKDGAGRLHQGGNSGKRATGSRERPTIGREQLPEEATGGSEGRKGVIKLRQPMRWRFRSAQINDKNGGVFPTSDLGKLAGILENAIRQFSGYRR